MKANEYQAAALSTAAYVNKEYPFLALAEEAGEVMGKIAKYVRKQQKPVGITIMEAMHPRSEPSEKLRADLIKELGDVQWQLAMCAYEIGVDLSEVMEANIDKLQVRADLGTIIGEGDDR